MHIAILYQHYLRPGESGHSRVNEYARLWSGAGHRVSVITSQVSYMTGRRDPTFRGRLCVRESDGPVEVLRTFVPGDANRTFLRRASAYFAFAASSAWAYRRIARPDVLLVSSPPLTVGFGALLIKTFSRVPMVFEVRDLWPESAITTGVLRSRAMIRLLYHLERACYRRAACVTVLTPAFRENILRRGLLPEARVRHVPSGVDTLEMAPEKRSEDLRARLGWSGRTVVLYTGAVGKANRVQQLVEAAAILRGRRDLLFAVVGDGMEVDAVRRLAAERGLGNFVLHGPAPKEEMAAITASADICAAVLMRNDTFKTVYPNKVFDYLACARPVVLGIDGIARDLVESAGAGLFAEPENPAALAAAVARLADDPAEAAEMGRRGRALVTERFDRRATAREYLDLLRAVAGGGREPGSRPAGDAGEEHVDDAVELVGEGG